MDLLSLQLESNERIIIGRNIPIVIGITPVTLIEINWLKIFIYINEWNNENEFFVYGKKLRIIFFPIFSKKFQFKDFRTALRWLDEFQIPGHLFAFDQSTPLLVWSDSKHATCVGCVFFYSFFSCVLLCFFMSFIVFLHVFYHVFFMCFIVFFLHVFYCVFFK